MNVYRVEERDLAARVTVSSEQFYTREQALDWWNERIEATAQFGWYEPHARVRLVLVGPDHVVLAGAS